MGVLGTTWAPKFELPLGPQNLKIQKGDACIHVHVQYMYIVHVDWHTIPIQTPQ